MPSIPSNTQYSGYVNPNQQGLQTYPINPTPKYADENSSFPPKPEEPNWLGIISGVGLSAALACGLYGKHLTGKGITHHYINNGVGVNGDGTAKTIGNFPLIVYENSAAGKDKDGKFGVKNGVKVALDNIDTKGSLKVKGYLSLPQSIDKEPKSMSKEEVQAVAKQDIKISTTFSPVRDVLVGFRHLTGIGGGEQVKRIVELAKAAA